MLRKCCVFFFFNDTATTEIYTLSLHDALPIYNGEIARHPEICRGCVMGTLSAFNLKRWIDERSEEHTSELQSRLHLVCRLLLEKKKKTVSTIDLPTRPTYTHQ